MKKFLGILAAVAVVGALILPAAPASATAAGGAVGACQVTLDWPGSGGADPCGGGSLPLEGQAVGAFLPGGPICAPLCDFGATVDSYSEICTPVGPPLVGQASGTLTVRNASASVSAHYSWVRVGLTAVVVFDGGTVGGGVAAFIPTPPLPTCALPGRLTAHVAGLALAAQP